MDLVLLVQLPTQPEKRGLDVAVGGGGKVQYSPNDLRMLLLQQSGQFCSQAGLSDTPHAVVDQNPVLLRRKLRNGFLESSDKLFPIRKLSRAFGPRFA